MPRSGKPVPSHQAWRRACDASLERARELRDLPPESPWWWPPLRLALGVLAALAICWLLVVGVWAVA